VQQTMSALEAECEASGQGTFFRETRSFLSGERDGAAYTQVAQRLNMAGELEKKRRKLRSP